MNIQEPKASIFFKSFKRDSRLDLINTTNHYDDNSSLNKLLSKVGIKIMTLKLLILDLETTTKLEKNKWLSILYVFSNDDGLDQRIQYEIDEKVLSLICDKNEDEYEDEDEDNDEDEDEDKLM
ncbi:hypothetical protein ACTFIY_010530 [Dictyostelium cf. discoideum]